MDLCLILVYFAKKIPDVLVEQALRNGANPECVKVVQDAFNERVTKGFTKINYDTNLGRAHHAYMVANGMPELMAKIEEINGNATDKTFAADSFTFTWCDPQDIIDNIEYIYHTHAKCYNTSGDYEETSIPIKEVVEAYKKAGYNGYLSTEYEGNRMLNDFYEVDSVEQVRRHQEALRRAIEE